MSRLPGLLIIAWSRASRRASMSDGAEKAEGVPIRTRRATTAMAAASLAHPRIPVSALFPTTRASRATPGRGPPLAPNLKSRADSGKPSSRFSKRFRDSVAAGARHPCYRSAMEGPLPDQNDVLAFMGSPGAYDPTPARVVRIETHASVVFLAGNRAYKVKRAVKYPFL